MLVQENSFFFLLLIFSNVQILAHTPTNNNFLRGHFPPTIPEFLRKKATNKMAAFFSTHQHVNHVPTYKCDFAPISRGKKWLVGGCKPGKIELLTCIWRVRSHRTLQRGQQGLPLPPPSGLREEMKTNFAQKSPRETNA